MNVHVSNGSQVPHQSCVCVCVCACVDKVSNGEAQIKIEREVCKERDGTEAMVVLPEGGVVVTGLTKP